jgi:hypothetical protein
LKKSNHHLYFTVTAATGTSTTITTPTTSKKITPTTLSMTTTSVEDDGSTVPSPLPSQQQQCPSNSNVWDSNNPQHIEKAKQELKIWPLDEYNTILLNEVHPIQYTTVTTTTGTATSTTSTNTTDDNNHTVLPEYDLIAVGSGAGGLVSSKQSARRNAKSALISAHLAGGDCLNVGVRLRFVFFFCFCLLDTILFLLLFLLSRSQNGSITHYCITSLITFSFFYTYWHLGIVLVVCPQ